MGDPDAGRAPQIRIPVDAKPKDLIPGNPDDIDDLVLELRAYAGAFQDGKDKLRPLELADWSGKGASEFRKSVDRLPKELTSGHDQFTHAASALAAYATKLRSVQKRCEPIIEDADAARAASKSHNTKVETYNDAVKRGDEQLPDRPSETDPGIAAMESCVGRLDKLIEELQLVVDASKKKIDKAAEKAPNKPSNWHKLGDSFKDGLWKVHHGILGLGEIPASIVKGDGKGLAMQLAGMADGAAYAAQHPKEFAKAVTNWDMWSKDPLRAAGEITPSLLLALATGGASALRKELRTGQTAAQRLALRKRDLGRDGEASRRADSDGTQDRHTRDKDCETDPVDVATGEMVMPATDVSLPGALPMVLERTFVSGHTCGGWFGRTWAATLDQRLELDADGIVFVTADGMVLRYGVPTPGEDTYPARGPHWPLRWDGAAGGTMRIEMPERARTLHFTPLGGNGNELPLEVIEDRNGRSITFTYDEEGTPREVAHSGGYRIAIDTDPELARITGLRLLGVGAAEGGTTLVSFGYNGAGDLTEVFNSAAEPMRFTYDDQHRVTSWTDRNGTSFGYVYDHRGRVLRTIGSDDMMTGRFHYDEASRTTVYTDSLGHRITYVFDEAYRAVSRTDALGHTTHTEWDPETRRLPLTVTDPLGHTTRYAYDDSGNLIRVDRADGTSATATYDGDGRPLEVCEPDGAVWRHAYDDRGNRVRTTDPMGAETHYAYDESGNLTSVVDPLGHAVTVVCDAAGLPIEVTDALGNTTTVRRGTHGRITRVTDPLGHVTRQGWTIEGKPAWRTRPDGSRETWTWDAEGNLTEHTDPAGNTTRHTHTHFDLPATRTDPDGATYAFAYDTELRLTAVTNPQGRTWTYAYDGAGQVTAETDFNGRTLSYEHDAAGRLISRENGAGEALAYTRDALGRTVATRTADGTETTFAYDAASRLTRAANPDTELSRTYDARGRVVTETVGDRTTSYAYDAAGNRTERITPSGLHSTWAYDATGRPTTLTTADNSLHFAYDAAGRETSRTFGDDVTLTQGWDALDRMTGQTVTGPANALIQHRAYSYRPDDHLTEIRELTSGTRRFDLDPVGRVTAVHAHGWTETYAYDAAGNLTHATAPGHESSGDREFTGTVIHRAGRTTYEHDAQGRLTRRTRKLLNGQTRTWTYTWNAEDRLTDATTPDGERWHYMYDPLGRRISKQRLAEDGTVAESVDFTWDGTRLAEQLTPEGVATTWDYAPGTHRPITQTDQRPSREPVEEASSLLRRLTETTAQSEYDARFYAIITDLVGTPTELVNPDGTLAWQHRTTLWGTPLPAPPGSVNCPLRFPGQYADPETGLHYNYFRHYDPETARYTSPDPLGLAPTAHPSSYIRNPHTLSDPLGLAPACPADGKSNRERPPLEGDTNYIVDNPADWSDTITDIDKIQDGVLWEEKTATGQNPNMKVEPWINKHVFKKLDSYVRARTHLEGWEDAPIGLHFTEQGATPAFKNAVEAGVESWRQSHPGVDVRVRWE
ncbi:putative T7SS-secreted protein [Streptomyces sp. NPDC020125]|uniref:putative T7SS-secreted protein n=1 Tax=Streptomyces sp. NPDC020125 TaxID=3154593 RepID=UPI0034024557